MAEVCVVGAGPAGCVFAARMAQLGHQVRLIEQARFPRSRLGESLSPGVTPLLKAARLERALDAQRVMRVRNVWVDWADGPRLREDPREQGLIVDRGAFDLGLIESRPRLRRRGPPTRARPRPTARGRAMAAHDRRRRTNGNARCRFSGRSRADAAPHRAGAAREPERRRSRSSPIGGRLACRRRRESKPERTPGSGACRCRTEPTTRSPSSIRRRSGAAPGALAPRFLDALARSRLMEDCREAERVGPVRAVDATPYLADDVRRRTRRSAWATQRWRSIRSRPAASRRRSKARFRAPSSPTPWFGGPKRRVSPWASTGPN